MTVLDRVGTCNAYVELTDAQANHLLLSVLRQLQPELLGVQEWDGPKPDLSTLRARERQVDTLVERSTHGSHFRFARPAGGGNPVVWNASRYEPLAPPKRVALVGPEFVGQIAGRKSRLPASTLTVAPFRDLVLGGRTTLNVMHLTAEVQHGGGYYTDLKHAARVHRHRRERAAVARIVAAQTGTSYLAGDTNFDGMTLPGLTACWVGHPRAEAAGTLGPRTVDYVYADDAADHVDTLPTRSDHDAVVATYRRPDPKEHR